MDVIDVANSDLFEVVIAGGHIVQLPDNRLPKRLLYDKLADDAVKQGREGVSRTPSQQASHKPFKL